MTRKSARTLAVAVGFLMLVSLPVPALAAPASTSFVTMVSERGDYIGGGASRLWTPSTSTISVTGSVGGEVTVDSSGGTSGDQFDFTFSAPRGQDLTAGSYENAQRSPFRTGTHPGIDINGDGRGCNETTGRFTVLDIAPDLSRLWLVYEQHCEGGQSAVFGEIRYNVPDGDSDLLVAPGKIAWPAEYPGVPARIVPVTLVNTGAAPVTVSDASVTDGGTDFSVVQNACTTIAVGESCSVYVGFEPTTSGSHTGTMTIQDSTATGVHTVDLSGAGIAGHTSWAMNSDPGDYVGGGSNWSYTPADSTFSGGGNESHVELGVATGDEYWYANFTADSGHLLLPGTTFTNTTRYPFYSSSTPSMSVDGSNGSCNTATGSFTVREAVYDGGVMKKFSVTFVQHCDGMEPALRGSIVWRADNPAEPVPDPQPTSLTISADKRTYSYGETAQVVAHLGDTASNRTVSIYATPQGGPEQRLAQGVVDANGDLAISTPVVEQTTFVARYVGDMESAATHDALGANVRAGVTSALVNSYRTPGLYHLYHLGRRPRLTAQVRPDHGGDCAHVSAQQLVDGVWRALSTPSCARLDAQSRLSSGLAATRQVGDRFRMRAEWPGDEENAPAKARWQYARVTR